MIMLLRDTIAYLGALVFVLLIVAVECWPITLLVIGLCSWAMLRS